MELSSADTASGPFMFSHFLPLKASIDATADYDTDNKI